LLLKQELSDIHDESPAERYEKVALCDLLRLWGGPWDELTTVVQDLMMHFPLPGFRERLCKYVAEFAMVRFQHVQVRG